MSSIKIFVGNIPYKCNNEEFKNIFINEEGFIKSEVQDNYSNTTKGFGFIEFDNKENAQKCLDKEFEFKSRQLRLSEYKSKLNDYKKIFVKDLDVNLSLTDFEQYFLKFGKLTKFYLITDRYTGDSKGMGVIEFETDESYIKSINEPNPCINGKKITIHPYKEKYNQIKNNNKSNHSGNNYNNYINGYNSGYSSGFNNGFKEGYKKGFDDSKVGKIEDPITSYIKNLINNNQ